MNKILTISIAGYNVEKYIEKALQSCISNNIINDIEILVIDDGGQDKTAEIADKYNTLYPDTVKVIRKENGGYGSTINFGIQVARGLYFKLLDGDDWFDTKGLELLLDDLKVHNVDMILTPNVKYYENTGKEEIRDNAREVEPGEYDFNDLDMIQSLNMHSVTFRTQMLRENGIIISEHCFYTDTEFVLFPLPFVNRVLISHSPVYYYRIGLADQSVSYSGVRKHFSDYLKVLENVYNLYNSLNDYNNVASKIIHYRLVGSIVNQYKRFCMLNINKENYKNLKEFDNKLKQNKDIYMDAETRSRFVTILRKTKFMVYPLFCIALKLRK